MKRKLEAELISIAHRILKIKNKSELVQLQQETLKLYEKISVLRFVEENFSEVKPTIGYAKAEKEVEAIFDAAESVATEPLDEKEPEVIKTEVEVSDFPAEDNAEEVTVDENSEDIEEPTVAEEEEIVEEIVDEEPETIEEVIAEEPEIEFAPLFEILKDEQPEIILPKQITLEDFLSEGHVEPIFVRAEQSYTNETTTTQTDPEDHKETVTKVEVVETKKTEFVIDHHEPKSVSLNDSLSKTINIGLNDRIGFEKHLFGGSSEDLNRVLSQLSTFSSFSEAEEFVQDMVKPDYNNWAGKDEYATRFMEIIEKKFS
ncbi:hypothetical protein [Flavobacterium sp. SM2513]|uniref:hypothetical protein n=1 Tax=Flavobacterium sp. SM2513 TaxID=3424766 RepID=UPI003D7F236E